MHLNITRLREEMIRMGLKQRDLAEKVGVSEISMSRYCNGHRMPREHVLVKIARALQTTPEYLTGKEDEKDHQDAYLQAWSIIRVHCKNWDNDDKIVLIQKLLDEIQ